jgi:hypothetical protein
MIDFMVNNALNQHSIKVKICSSQKLPTVESAAGLIEELCCSRGAPFLHPLTTMEQLLNLYNSGGRNNNNDNNTHSPISQTPSNTVNFLERIISEKNHEPTIQVCRPNHSAVVTREEEPADIIIPSFSNANTNKDNLIISGEVHNVQWWLNQAKSTQQQRKQQLKSMEKKESGETKANRAVQSQIPIKFTATNNDFSDSIMLSQISTPPNSNISTLNSSSNEPASTSTVNIRTNNNFGTVNASVPSVPSVPSVQLGLSAAEITSLDLHYLQNSCNNLNSHIQAFQLQLNQLQNKYSNLH